MRWFEASGETIAFIVASTAAIYGSTLLMVRIAGRRTVAQLSAFDIVVTIALGTLVSSTAVSERPTYLEGVTAIATLLLLQTAIAWARQRSDRFRRIVDFSPEVLGRDGRPELPRSILGPQVTLEELMMKVRESGTTGLEATRLVVLEPSGRVSVLRRPGDDPPDVSDAGASP